MSTAVEEKTALRVACWAMEATADLTVNARAIEQGLRVAAAAGTRVLLTPECALVGYPGAARADLIGIDWCAVAEHEERLALLAERLGLSVVLGTASPDGAGGITNDAFAVGRCEPTRYRKRALTPGDRRYFAVGSRAVQVRIDGWQCGLGICYDLRFPGLWAEHATADVDALLVIAHMAGADVDPGTKAEVVPAFCAVRAAETATPLAFANTAAADRWLDSGCWDAQGRRQASAAQGLVVTELVHRDRLDPWYHILRRDYLSRRS